MENVEKCQKTRKSQKSKKNKKSLFFFSKNLKMLKKKKMFAGKKNAIILVLQY